MASLRSLRKEKELLHETCIILLRQQQPGQTGEKQNPWPLTRGLRCKTNRGERGWHIRRSAT